MIEAASYNGGDVLRKGQLVKSYAQTSNLSGDLECTSDSSYLSITFPVDEKTQLIHVHCASKLIHANLLHSSDRQQCFISLYITHIHRDGHDTEMTLRLSTREK